MTVHGMKSPDIFGSCWEIWAKEQPVADLYPVSMILIKTLWRSGGLPVLVESKSLPVFCTWLPEINYSIMLPSWGSLGLILSFLWPEVKFRKCPEKFWWIEEYRLSEFFSYVSKATDNMTSCFFICMPTAFQCIYSTGNGVFYFVKLHVSVPE